MSSTKVKIVETETIVNKTLVKETETHIFKITNFNPELSNGKYRGTVVDKETNEHCGDFIVTTGIRNMLSLNINLDCKTVVAEILDMIEKINSGEIE